MPQSALTNHILLLPQDHSESNTNAIWENFIKLENFKMVKATFIILVRKLVG